VGLPDEFVALSQVSAKQVLFTKLPFTQATAQINGNLPQIRDLVMIMNTTMNIFIISERIY